MPQIDEYLLIGKKLFKKQLIHIFYKPTYFKYVYILVYTYKKYLNLAF